MQEQITFRKDWAKMPSSSIGSNANLLDFLKDYKKVFKGDVNPSCPSCLNEYILKLKKYIMNKKDEKKEPSDYILLSKREGLPLVFGSDIFLYNSNLTNEYAEILFNRLKVLNKDITLEQVFSKFPTTATKSKTIQLDPEKAKKAFLKKSKEEIVKIANALGVDVTVDGAETKEELFNIIENAKKGLGKEVEKPVVLTKEEEPELVKELDEEIEEIEEIDEALSTPETEEIEDTEDILSPVEIDLEEEQSPTV